MNNKYLSNHPLAELSRALDGFSIHYAVLEHKEFGAVLEGYLQKYCGAAPYSFPIWELLDDTQFDKMQTSFAWEKLATLLPSKPVIVFFDPHDAPEAAIRLDNVSQ